VGLGWYAVAVIAAHKRRTTASAAAGNFTDAMDGCDADRA
jgi:hypothetical protein